MTVQRPHRCYDYIPNDVEKVSEWMSLVRRQMLLDLWDALPGHEASGDCAGSLRAMLLLSEVGDEIRQTRLIYDDRR